MPASGLPTLFVLGDSITVQYSVYLKPYLAERFQFMVKQSEGDAFADLDVPQGSSGGDSRMVLDYLSTLDKEGGLHADMMLLNCGLHDIKVDPQTRALQTPIEQYEQNLRAIVAIVQKANVPLVWARTTESVDEVHNGRNNKFYRYAKDNEAYTALADAVMTQMNVPLLDLRGFTRSLGGNELYCDHVHYHDEIRRQQASYITGWVLAYAEHLLELKPSTAVTS